MIKYPIPRFGGLNLRDDPQEIGSLGAIDLINVDFDSEGRLRSRDGFDNFTTAAAAARRVDVAFYTNTANARRLISAHRTGTTMTVEAINPSGAVAVSTTVTSVPTDPYFLSTVRFGGPNLEYMFITAGFIGTTIQGSPQTVYFDGTTFTAPPGIGNYIHFALQSVDNRLVAVEEQTSLSRVSFSDPGLPLTVGANTVDLAPGDGGSITALCNWQNLVFAFKNSAKFFAFYGNSVGPTGVPVFNYRAVDKIGCVTWGGAIAGLDGVYFIDKRGVYRTRGDTAELVSTALDPLFRGLSSIGISPINQEYLPFAKIAYHDERIFVSVPTGSSTVNNTLLVYSPLDKYWTVWDIPVNGMCSAPMSSAYVNDLCFSYATGANHIGRVSSSFTTDDGVAIPTRYQSGFYQPVNGAKTTTRWTTLWGSGTVTVDILTDHALTDPLTRGGAIALGIAPGVAKGFHLKSYMGDYVSHKLSSTSGAWSVNRLEHDIAFGSNPS